MCYWQTVNTRLRLIRGRARREEKEKVKGDGSKMEIKELKICTTWVLKVMTTRVYSSADIKKRMNENEYLLMPASFRPIPCLQLVQRCLYDQLGFWNSCRLKVYHFLCHVTSRLCRTPEPAQHRLLPFPPNADVHHWQQLPQHAEVQVPLDATAFSCKECKVSPVHFRFLCSDLKVW